MSIQKGGILVPAPFSQCRSSVPFMYQYSILRRVPRGGAETTPQIKDDDAKEEDEKNIGDVDNWMKSFEDEVQSLRLEMEAEAKREMDEVRREYYTIEESRTKTTTIIPPKSDTIRSYNHPNHGELGGEEQLDLEEMTGANMTITDVLLSDNDSQEQDVTHEEHPLEPPNPSMDNDPLLNSNSSKQKEDTISVMDPLLNIDGLEQSIRQNHGELGGEELDLKETTGSSNMTITDVLSNNGSQQQQHVINEENIIEPPNPTMYNESLYSNSSKRNESKIPVMDPPLTIDGLAHTIRHCASKKDDHRRRRRRHSLAKQRVRHGAKQKKRSTPTTPIRLETWQKRSNHMTKEQEEYYIEQQVQIRVQRILVKGFVTLLLVFTVIMVLIQH